MTKRAAINEALRLLRLYCRFSQSEMADKLGVAQSMISDIESGRKTVSMDVLERYSQALNIKMSRLLSLQSRSKVNLRAARPTYRRGTCPKLLERLRPTEYAANKQRYERYSFQNSPWCQDLTQRDLAELLGTRKARLEALIDHKDEWVIRRKLQVGHKLRDLAYPRGKLRTIHERIKYHLNKIRQPPYVMSPRKGKSQRDNAATHKGRNQFLKLDIRQFYPATTSEHIFRWAHYAAGLRPDVAGMFAHLVTIDDKLPFGSPISPVLATLVHRSMFDDICDACTRRGLRMSLWVDDLTISGLYVPGELVEEVREIIRLSGLQSHKIEFLSGSRPVIVTGIPIVGNRIEAPRALQNRIKIGYAQLSASKATG